MPSIAGLREGRKYFWLWLATSILLLVPIILVWQNRDMLANMLTQADKESLAGVVIENYSGGNPVRDIQITVDGKTVKITEPGRFNVDNLTKGKHIVTATGKSYEDEVEDIDIKKGKNKCIIKVSLTPVEAAHRWMETKKQNKYAETYSLIHPDDKKWINKNGYIRFKIDMQRVSNLKIKSYKIESPKLLKTWKHHETKKIYKDVVMMRANVIMEIDQAGAGETGWNIYAQNINGRWAFFSVGAN